MPIKRENWNEYCRNYYLANRDRIKAQRKRRYRTFHPRERAQSFKSKLKCLYGLSLERFKAIWDSQDGKCANLGCRIKLDIKGKYAIDHCHKAGHVRGILCGHCNTAAGMLRNSSRAAHGLADYLAREIIFNGE